MTHRLEIRNGQASFFYLDEEPWHGLGTKLDRPATAEEAIAAANLDWTVKTVPLYFTGQQGAVRIENKYATVREDLWDRPDCQALGIVSSQYVPLQNRDAFKFFDPIVGQKAAVYHTAGVLDGGKRIWILAKLPDNIRVIGDDIVDKYLLLSNSHDGSSAVAIKFTPIRVVCDNTLTMALNNGPTLRIVHTLNMQQRLRQAKELLGIVHTQYGTIERDFQAMSKIRMNSQRLNNYFNAVFPDPEDPENFDALQRAQNNRLRAEYLFEQGKGSDVKGVRGTLWAAYNGITELVDHRISGVKHQKERHLNSIWFGNGYLLKARAYRIAIENIPQWIN